MKQPSGPLRWQRILLALAVILILAWAAAAAVQPFVVGR
jgi:hypothetical protein